MKSIGKRAVSIPLTAALAVLLAGCGTSGSSTQDPKPVSRPAAPSTDQAKLKPLLGDSFVVGDVTYTPADIPDYDAVGYAGIASAGGEQRKTVIGEARDPNAITAAHKTLPLPSFAEVTDLATGRTILVRVNDRGPMANDRLIDLSEGAARQLGLTGGVAAVRVRRTNPPEAEKARLRDGQPVIERLATPDTLLTILRRKLGELPVPATRAQAARAGEKEQPDPTSPPRGPASVKADRFVVEKAAPAGAPAVAKQPAAKTVADLLVQVAAFSSEASARAVARSLGGRVTRGGNLWRVQLGPFSSEGEAQQGLKKARAAGYADAMVLRER